MKSKEKLLTGENILIGIIIINVLVSILASFSIYRLPGMTTIIMFLLLAVFMIVTQNRGMLCVNNRDVKIYGLSWFLVYFLSLITTGVIPGFGLWVAMLFGILFLTLNSRIQEKIFYYYAWTLAIFLCISIIEYGIFQLTGRGIIIGNASRVTDYKATYFVHLLFNLVRTDIPIPRFQGLSNEPGLLGTLCGLFLFYTRREKKLKIPYFIFLFSGILSFSLAYYILLGIHVLSVIKLNWKVLIATVLVLFISFSMLRERFELLLLNRIAETENIDNRTSESFDKDFKRAYRQNLLWFGVGYKNVDNYISDTEGANAGGKIWIFQYGIVGLVVVVIAYGRLYFYRCGRKLQLYDWFFLFAFWLSFYQRQTIYTPYTILVFLAVSFESKKLISSENIN